MRTVETIPHNVCNLNSVLPKQEYMRQLEARLAAFATSEAGDEAALASQGSGWDWRDRRVVEFRKERKRALRLTLERLREREKTAYKLLATPVSHAAKEEL
jgi:hypothetical protein